MVTVYSKPFCPNCDKTKMMLKNLGVDYKEVDITEDPEALMAVREMGYMSAPVVVTPDGESWAGFSRDRIQELAHTDDKSMDSVFAY